jgi:4-aminobutyrate aminotransferase-like enzyme
VLQGLRSEVPQIADIRGPGAMVAVEFNRAGSGEPDVDMTKRVQAEALQRGLVLLSCGVNANVIRFLFPLTIQDGVFAEAMTILKVSLRAAAAM